MLVLFSFSVELETAWELTTRSPFPGQGPTHGQAPLQPRPGGKTLTSLGRTSELEARHVISPVQQHGAEFDLEGRPGL